MVVVVDRNDGLFDEAVADELNNAFNNINEMIANYKSIPLEYKETVRNLGNSFIVGNVFHIREQYTINNRLEEYTKLGSIPISIPYDIWTTAVSKTGESISIHIKEKSVEGFGRLTSYPQTVYVTANPIIPSI